MLTIKSHSFFKHRLLVNLIILKEMLEILYYQDLQFFFAFRCFI